MNKTLREQSGFGLVSIIVIIAVVAVIGFIGWRVWGAYHQTAKQPSASEQPTKSYQTFKNPEMGIAFTYPQGWNVEQSQFSDRLVVRANAPDKIDALAVGGQVDSSFFSVNFSKWNNNSERIGTHGGADELESMPIKGTLFEGDVRLVFEKTRISTSGQNADPPTTEVIVSVLLAKIIDPSKPITVDNLRTLEAGGKNFWGYIDFYFSSDPSGRSVYGDPTRYVELKTLKELEKFKQAVEIIKTLKPISGN